MKSVSCIVILLALVAASRGATATTRTSRNSLEDGLLKLLELWRTGEIRNIVSTTYLFPSLELIKLPPMEGFFNRKGAKLTYTTSELVLTGLKDFSVNEIEASKDSMKASIVFTVPVLSVYADKYKVKGTAYFIFPLSGAGKMWLKAKNLKISASIQLEPNGNSTKIVDMHIRFTVDQVEAKLEDSSWPINNVLNSDGVGILASYHDDLVAAALDLIAPPVSQYLATVTPAELYKTIEELSSHAGNTT